MKFAIKTLGCKVNTYESNFLRELLNNYCREEVFFSEEADIYVINTCTVTKTADKKSWQIIKQTKQKHPKAILIVLGCYLHFYSGKIRNWADILIGNNQKSEIINMIEKYRQSGQKQICLTNEKPLSFEDMQISMPKQTRAFVKIQDGCDNYCAYCIIPYVRGNPRSRDEEKIITEIKTLLNNGYQEIVLTGINTGAYGVDINKDFVSLLTKIIQTTKVARLRISSLEITALDDHFYNLLTQNNVIVDHLHIPLQSGSDKILKKMHRPYTVADFRHKIAKLYQVRPQMLITTDVIVGFPGESEEDFRATMALIKELRFFQLHVFAFSPKEFTKAFTMKEQVATNIKKERSQKLHALSEQIKSEHLHKYVNQSLAVLFEQKKGEYMIGYSSSYLPVMAPLEEGLLKEIVNVKIKEVSYPYLKGVIE